MTGTHLGVEQHGDVLPAAGGQRLPEALQGGGVALVVPVGKVEPRDVHARVHQAAEGLDAPAGGAEGADDLALPAGLIAFGEDLVLTVVLGLKSRQSVVANVILSM